MVSELLQKPFDLDLLIETVEDTSTYTKLQDPKINIKDLKSWNPTLELGVTIISISRVLEGPYVVTVDGEAVRDILVVDDQISQETIIRITHEQGAHEITIS